MGQAKLRGNQEARRAEAVARQEREAPINVPCQTCGEVLNGFTLLETMPAGALWQKTCTCGAITSAIVQAQGSTRERAFAASLKAKDAIAGPDRKVSVSFLEKTIDTVETGLIRI